MNCARGRMLVSKSTSSFLVHNVCRYSLSAFDLICNEGVILKATFFADRSKLCALLLLYICKSEKGETHGVYMYMYM